MTTLYISNNGPCPACDKAERLIEKWRVEGLLRQAVDVQPVPSDPGFESFVRLRTGGRWGWPLLHDTETQALILGFSADRYKGVLCW